MISRMISLSPQRRVAIGGGIELDTIDMGPRDGEALVFLHGFPESHRTWRHQIAHFSDRYRCVAPDQRGYRGSSRPDGVDDYAPGKLIGDVFRLADALGIGRFTIVGHDWGGAVAWGVALAGQHERGGAGTRVERAIIANAPHPAIFPKLVWTNPAQRAASQYFRAFRDAANDAGVRAHGLGPLLRRVLPGPDADRMEPEERARLDADWADGEAALAMLKWYRASPVDVPPMDAAFALPDDFRALPVPVLAIPTLVIWAMEDHALPPANLDGMEDMIERLTIERIAGCGHFVPWEAPQAVNAAMERFLMGG